MRFTLWQIDKLRCGLHAYRIAKAVNGRPAPWKKVHRDLVFTPETMQEYSITGEEPQLKEEALRRFALGKTILEAHKLQDVKSFLVAERIVVAEDFDSSEQTSEEARTVHAYLANDPSVTPSRLKKYTDRYVSEVTSKSVSHRVEIYLFRHSSETIFRVEEVSFRTDTEEVYLGLNKRDKFIEAPIRKGYGFLSTPHNVLNLFVRGASRHDQVHYVEVHPQSLDDGEMFLLRTGDYAKVDFVGVPTDTVLHACGIRCFFPAPGGLKFYLTE